jgi:hypothetical protein
VRLWNALKILIDWGRLWAQYVIVVYIGIKARDLGLHIIGGRGIILWFLVFCFYCSGLRVVGFNCFSFFEEAVGGSVANFSAVETTVFFEPLFSFSFG